MTVFYPDVSKPLRRSGVKPIRLHDARHSCGTAMHLRGVPLAVIAKWLGHADASDIHTLAGRCAGRRRR